MKVILYRNLEPPFNLRRTTPNMDFYLTATEDEVLAASVWKQKQVGLIPAETEAERAFLLVEFAELHPEASPIVLPPVGEHWIIEENDLPGGSISEENDYFFDAWEWVTDHVEVPIAKARAIHSRNIGKAKVRATEQLLLKMALAGDASEYNRLSSDLEKVSSFRPYTFSLSGHSTLDALKNAWPVELPTIEQLDRESLRINEGH